MSKFQRETNDIIEFIGDGVKAWDDIFNCFSKRLTRQQLNSVLRRREFAVVDHTKKQRYDNGAQRVRIFGVRNGARIK